MLQSLLEKKTKNNFIILLYSLFFGTGYCLYLIGSKLNPTNIDWLYFSNADPAQHFLGWMLFRHDSWSWPLTYTTSILYPTGASIAYTDSIPLFAIFFKFISGILPESFQYFGLFVLLSFILQFFWGAKIGLLFSENSLTCGILSGFLFMLAPPLTQRIFGHIALTSHWFILASIWSYFYFEQFKNAFTLQLFLILITTGIHPYIALMVFALSVANYSKFLMIKQINIRTMIIGCFVTSVCLILGFYFFGYFTSNAYYGDSGSYGYFTSNLLSPFNSQGYSSFLKPLKIKREQYEGFNYLGLGIIILFLVNIKPLLDSEKLKIFSSKKVLILLFFISLLTAFAISHRVFLGQLLIIEYELPTKVNGLLRRFHASGRFVWPIHYLILLGIIVSAFRAWSKKGIIILFTIICFIQFCDLNPLHKSVTKWIHYPDVSTELIAPEWQQISQHHKKIIVLESKQCKNSLLPKNTLPIFQRLAATYKLKINSFYLARYDKKAINIHCNELPNNVKAGKLEDDAIYILDETKYSPLIQTLNSNPNSSHYCSTIDNYIVCRKNIQKAKIK